MKHISPRKSIGQRDSRLSLDSGIEYSLTMCMLSIYIRNSLRHGVHVAARRWVYLCGPMYRHRKERVSVVPGCFGVVWLLLISLGGVF